MTTGIGRADRPAEARELERDEAGEEAAAVRAGQRQIRPDQQHDPGKPEREASDES